jgi:hypothetical protein
MDALTTSLVPLDLDISCASRMLDISLIHMVSFDG